MTTDRPIRTAAGIRLATKLAHLLGSVSIREALLGEALLGEAPLGDAPVRHTGASDEDLCNDGRRDERVRGGGIGTWRTRFAPAPTGRLHLGHVVNAMHVWGIARAYGGEVLLRIEDHDSMRCRPEFERALLDDLDWLGFTPDVGTTQSFRDGPHDLRQSDNAHRYEKALQRLGKADRHYGCVCSRRAIAESQGANSIGELRYPGTCATRDAREPAEAQITVARRFRVTDSLEQFSDLRLDGQQQHPASQCGDFLLRDRNGNFTYQFAVVVDDMEQRIDVVIRGEDLLTSTGRQLQLARTLGRSTPLQFLHHSLLLRPDGLKLSKSLGDTGVGELRAAGVSANDVLGRAAHASGLIERPIPLAMAELPDLFV